MAIRNKWLVKHIRQAAACLSVAAMLGIVSACSDPLASDRPMGASGPGSEPNYVNPINGDSVTIGKASRLVGFSIHKLPGNLVPRRVLETPGRPMRLRVVVVQYRLKPGLVDIFEERAGISLKDFRHVIAWWVKRNGKRGTTGTVKRVILTGNVPALVTVAADGATSSIEWIEGGLKFDIRGPSLSVRDCIRFANQLV